MYNNLPRQTQAILTVSNSVSYLFPATERSHYQLAYHETAPVREIITATVHVEKGFVFLFRVYDNLILELRTTRGKDSELKALMQNSIDFELGIIPGA